MSTPRSIVIPAALTVGLAAAVTIFFATRDREAKPDVVSTPDPVVQVEAPDEPARPAEPVARATPKPAAPSAPAEPAPAPAPAAAPVVEENAPPEPLTPEVRQHAKLMVVGTAQDAIERGDIDQLQNLVMFADDKVAAQEGLVAKNDYDAIKIAMSCLEGSADAQQKATAFLQFGPRSQLDDGLRKSCWEKLGKGTRGQQAQGDQPGQPAQAGQPAQPSQ